MANGSMAGSGFIGSVDFASGPCESRRLAFVNGSYIVLGEPSPYDTLIVFEGPDDVLRQLLQVANNSLAIWGKVDLREPGSQRYFHLENFYPRSLDSHLTELDPLVNVCVDQTFGHAYVRGRSNTILTLAKVMEEYIAPKFPSLRIEIRHCEALELTRFLYEKGCQVCAAQWSASQLSEADEWLEP